MRSPRIWYRNTCGMGEDGLARGGGRTEARKKKIEKEEEEEEEGKEERQPKRGTMPIEQARRQERARGTSEKSVRRYAWLE